MENSSVIPYPKFGMTISAKLIKPLSAGSDRAVGATKRREQTPSGIEPGNVSC
jgi:hypothetical protein